MKQNETNGSGVNQSVGSAFKNACIGSCQKIVAQIKKARDSIYAESRETLQGHRHLVELALNEAEALALQTTYPHLVFPTLAMEKVQAVTNWNEHQQYVRRGNRITKLAA